ncbi:helix-turn-helix domain-containing protein [Thalassococcus sp. S3]|uniref:helix-turn-helix domain-containing protein n=1 Tax=Thalassococcus sp. S3 TaxID=2017482 RepID=UPI0010248E60|nr:helix-turn-helix domain-containing protein [Thalassococcus sp. S3]QBF33032.1 hypothetical protein CFI11_17650 [Thalassococcus sp. S3]
MKTWQVRSDDTAQGLGKWASGLSEAFVRLEPVCTRQDGFFGQIQQITTAGIHVSLVTSNGHEIRRLDEHIRQSTKDTVFVNMLGRGRSFVVQQDSYQAAPMDLSIVDTRRPYSIRHDTPFQLISIAVPADWVPEDLQGHLALSRSAAGRELSNVIWSLARTLLAVPVSDPGFGQTVVDQLRQSVSLVAPLTKDQAPQSVHIDIMRSYVRRHFHHHDLNAKQLGLHFGLSVRRVHQLFEPTGQSVSEFINEIRLDQAAAHLSDLSAPQRLIADLAWSVGYSDPSYFNRRFRRRFGCTPRAYRTMALSGAIAQ